MMYFVFGFSLFFITSMTCGTVGETAEKCDIRIWYLTMIGEGTFSKDLTSQQEAIKATIEGMIQKSTENPELSNVDCTVLAMYESMFKDPKAENGNGSGNDPEVSATKTEQSTDADSTGEDDSEIADDPTEMGFDETEMAEDETESAETEGSEAADGTVKDDVNTADSQEPIMTTNNSSAIQEVVSNSTLTSNGTKHAYPPDFLTKTFAKCRKQRANKTVINCRLLNAVNFQCPTSSEKQYLPNNVTKEVLVTNSDDETSEEIQKATVDIANKVQNVGDSEASTSADADERVSDTKTVAQPDSKHNHEASTDSIATDSAQSDLEMNAEAQADSISKTKTSEENKSAETSEEKLTEEKPLSETGGDSESITKTVEGGNISDEKQTMLENEKDLKEDTVRRSRSDHSVNAFDLDQFRMLIDQKTGEYTIKIQSMETQIVRLENQLLMEKLNKQNHSSSFNRLENQILRLENELLKMTLNYDEIKTENENIKKKQNNFLELDYVKHPGENGGDNSSKQFELISTHQNKISELTDHLRNHSQLIEKIRGQSNFLEEQNRSLFQIVMNQTMLVSQIMKKVQTLSDSNLKHQMEQHELQQKLQIALASNHVMDDLNSIVSDRLADRPNPRVSDKVDHVPRTASDEPDLEKIRKLKRIHVNNDDENIELSKYLQQTSHLAIYGCKQSKRSKLKCKINSYLSGKCLPSDNSSGGFVTTSKTSMSNTDAQKDDKLGEKGTNPEKPDIKTKESAKEQKENKIEDESKNEKTDQPDKSDNKDNRDSESKNEASKAQSTSEETKSTNEVEKVVIGEASNGNGIEGADQNGVQQANGELENKSETPGIDRTKEQLVKQETKLEDAMEEQRKPEETNDTKKSSDSVSQSSSNKPQPELPKLDESQRNDTAVNNKGGEEKKSGNQPIKGKVEPTKTRKLKAKSKTEAKKVIVQRIPPLYNVTKQVEPKDCYDYWRRGSSNKKDGQFKIRLHGTENLVPVYCDMKNGGWTVIQRRQDGTVNFFRSWDEYKKGFGGIYGEHWLGNDILHRLTNQDQYELRVDLMDWNKTKKHALYEYMRVEDEAEGYRLHVEGYSGDAGDGFSKHHGEKFSTKDMDNDKVVKEFGGSCANRFKGAWWYYKCYASNLNGKFYKKGQIPEKLFDGITWKPWTGPNISLKKVEIKVRPISANSGS